MLIPCRGDTLPVQRAGLVQASQLLQRLSAMKVGGGVGWISRYDGSEFVHRRPQLTFIDIFHRQTIARERAARVLFEQLPEDFYTGGCQSVRIPPWPVLFLDPSVR